MSLESRERGLEAGRRWVIEGDYADTTRLKDLMEAVKEGRLQEVECEVAELMADAAFETLHHTDLADKDFVSGFNEGMLNAAGYPSPNDFTSLN